MGSLVGKVTALVLAAEVEGHEDGEDGGHGSGGEESAVARSVVRSIILAEDEAGDGTTQVTETDVHGNTDTSLERATNIVTVPGDTLGNVGVDTAGDHEAGKVLGVVVVSAEKDGETSDGDEAEADHVETSLAVLVSGETTTDGEEAGHDVGRNRHELGHGVAVSETLDNGGKEDGDGVERGVDADGDDHVDPDLPVLHGVLEELHVELVGENGAILLKTAEDFLSLTVGEELGSVGVVVHDKEGNDSEEEGDDALDDEDPGPASEVANTVHLHDATGKETTEGTSSSGGGEEDGHAKTALVSAIPHGDVVGDTGEETTLSKTESHADTEKTTEVLDKTHDGGHDGPHNHDEGNPERGAETLHGHVGGNLSGDVEGEEDGDGNLQD